MAPQGGHGVAVQVIARHGVAHQVEAALPLLDLPQHSLGLGHGAALQPADDIIGNTDNLRKFHGTATLLRAQGAAGRGHTHPLQGAVQPLLQAVGHPAGHLGHLSNIFNLAVQHGPLAMLLLLDGQHLKALVHHPARDADDAAGSDVQRKDQAAVLRLSFCHPAAPPMLL